MRVCLSRLGGLHFFSGLLAWDVLNWRMIV